MIKLILLSFCLILPVVLYAEINKPAIQLLHEMAPQPKVFPAYQTPTPKRAYTPLPQELSWQHSLQELFIDGGMQFEYAGRKYSIKLGFDRGTYDSYVQNYKSLHIFIFSQIRIGEAEAFSVWPIVKLYKSNSASLTLNDGRIIRLAVEGGSVMIYTNTGAKITSFLYAQFWSVWEQNAYRYPRNYKGVTGYFVPQSIPINNTYRSGYVVSESYPYFPTTRMPLDFVELYKYDAANTAYTYKPTAYSIPLGLVFKFSGGVTGNYWVLDELRPEDLQDALADELKSDRELNITLDKRIGTAMGIMPIQVK
ncbi:MAG: hypothetical protein Q7R35_08725 [Elusimicrobiota bacterium]|nr:hypothetical protein [Elusimicrobiota bacterium]